MLYKSVKFVLHKETSHYKEILFTLHLIYENVKKLTRNSYKIHKKVATVKQMIFIAVHPPGYSIPYKPPISIFVVAVMHIDQRMEPKDRAFQACFWSLQGIQSVRFMHGD